MRHYNTDRVHSSTGDSPEGRASEPRPDGPAAVAALGRVGGLHHRYTWREAAWAGGWIMRTHRTTTHTWWLDRSSCEVTDSLPWPLRVLVPQQRTDEPWLAGRWHAQRRQLSLLRWIKNDPAGCRGRGLLDEPAPRHARSAASNSRRGGRAVRGSWVAPDL